MIHEDIKYLEYCLKRIDEVCAELGITLNRKKTRIIPIQKGITFLKTKFILTETGYVVRKMSRPSIRAMKRKLGARRLWLGGGKQMTIQLDMTGLLALMSIPSAITGFCFWLLQKNITKRDADRNKQEEAQKKNELLLIRGVGAAITLGEATARAVQRIPDAHCNGDMHEALEYAQKVKHEQQDFLREQGIENLY